MRSTLPAMHSPNLLPLRLKITLVQGTACLLQKCLCSFMKVATARYSLKYLGCDQIGIPNATRSKRLLRKKPAPRIE